MKISQNTRLAGLFLGALLGFTAGCGTTDTLASRIRQNHELFAGLSAEEKNQIEQGIITVGFSPDMVFMALGKPERIVPGRGPGAEEWVYVNMYSLDGSSLAMSSKVTMQYPMKPGSSAGGAPQYYKFYSEDTKRASGLAGGWDSIPAPTYQLEPDLANEQIKAESAIKVHVKFTEGTVEDIQIVTDGKG